MRILVSGDVKFTQDRTCGDCYECCIWLGISELRKYAGRACKHLSGGTNPDHRCSIYDKRPLACSQYRCTWLQGYGPEGMRPRDSGLILTLYESDITPGKQSANVMVIDKSKAKPFVDQILADFLTVGIEVKLCYMETMSGYIFTNGKILRCRIERKQAKDDYETFQFNADAEPISTYHTELADATLVPTIPHPTQPKVTHYHDQEDDNPSDASLG